MPQQPQSPQTHSQPCHPLHLEILSGKTQAVYPSPHIHIPGQQNWGEGGGQRGCRPWQGPPPPGAAKGHPKTPGHAARLLCPHDTHPNLWGTPLPLPTPSPLPLQTPTAPQLPQLQRMGVNIPGNIPGKGQSPSYSSCRGVLSGCQGRGQPLPGLCPGGPQHSPAMAAGHRVPQALLQPGQETESFN